MSREQHPSMDEDVRAFYDSLAGSYHLIFEDWERSVIRQGETLDRLFRNAGLGRGSRVLDCSCGIGTQTLGLARLGYDMLGSDLSPQSIERARANAGRMGLRVDFQVADFRALEHSIPDIFDAVICFDNSLPHMLSKADVRSAVSSMFGKLSSGGQLLASIRDYDSIIRERPRAMPVREFDTLHGKRRISQLWDWSKDGESYRLTHIIEAEDAAPPRRSTHSTRYRPLLRAELSSALETAGFGHIRWLTPEATGHYQPVVSACRS